ncbi:MAG: DnaJ domain-containing protein [bacterium]|nr:DnaJ domain-containing protein [bacterium]
MSKWGAGMGGLFGFWVGGPLGAIIGAVVGSSFGNNGEAAGAGVGRQPGQSGKHHAVFMATVFAMFGKLAKADGNVSREEVAAVDEFISRHLNLNPEQRRFAIGVFNEAKDNDTPIEAYARQFAQVYRHDHQLREAVYRMMVMLAQSDGAIHPKERDILKSLPYALGLDAGIYESLVAQQHGDLKGFYDLLEVSPEASDTEVKRAYHKKTVEHHPDKLVSKGLPDSFMKYADEQMKLINNAYDEIMKARETRH